jgi:hypothetical protein
VGVLSVILFLLGILFIFLGWRWQSPPSDEAKTALKGLAYLKREISGVQNQVHLLEDKLQKTLLTEIKKAEFERAGFNRVEFNEAGLKKSEHKVTIDNEIQRNVIGQNEIKHLEIKPPEVKQNEIKPKEIKHQEVGLQEIKHQEVERYISPKYQEVLELAAQGQRIPDIAQRLLLSQDAVMMVLRTHPKGGTQ